MGSVATTPVVGAGYIVLRGTPRWCPRGAVSLPARSGRRNGSPNWVRNWDLRVSASPPGGDGTASRLSRRYGGVERHPGPRGPATAVDVRPHTLSPTVDVESARPSPPKPPRRGHRTRWPPTSSRAPRRDTRPLDLAARTRTCVASARSRAKHTALANSAPPPRSKAVGRMGRRSDRRRFQDRSQSSAPGLQKLRLKKAPRLGHCGGIDIRAANGLSRFVHEVLRERGAFSAFVLAAFRTGSQEVGRAPEAHLAAVVLRVATPPARSATPPQPTSGAGRISATLAGAIWQSGSHVRTFPLTSLHRGRTDHFAHGRARRAPALFPVVRYDARLSDGPSFGPIAHWHRKNAKFSEVGRGRGWLSRPNSGVGDRVWEADARTA